MNNEIDLNALREKFLSRLGQFVRLTYRGEIKMKKSYNGEPITKITEVTCRAGVNYENLKIVKDRRESGELPEKNTGLKGMSWVIFPHILIGDKSKEESFRFTVLNENNNKITRYFIGDKEVSKDQIPWEHSYSSNGKNRDIIFNVKSKNIIDLK